MKIHASAHGPAGLNLEAPKLAQRFQRQVGQARGLRGAGGTKPLGHPNLATFEGALFAAGAGGFPGLTG